jgi:transmembrane sensor
MRTVPDGQRQAMTSDDDVPDRPDALTSLDPVTREAIAWLVRMRSGLETEGDRLEYESWKSMSAERRAAAEHAEQLWDMMGPALARSKSRERGRLPVVVAAVVGLGAILFGAGVFGPPQGFFPEESTGTGERRSVVLPDGSLVELDTGTSFDVAEGGRLVLLYAGQIFVTVARDPSRAFAVRTGAGTVEALGTAFNLRQDGAATTVTVTESRVRVTVPTAGVQPSTSEASAGEAITFRPDTGISLPLRADLVARTAWRRGELRFEERPLGEVMAELGRYQRGAVVFTDDSLRRLPVTGVFRVDNADSMLNAIALLAPVTITRLPWLTIVRRDDARSAAPSRR